MSIEQGSGNRAKSILVELFVVIAIGLVLGAIGPFGTSALSAGPRLLYWVCFIIIGYIIFRPVSVVARWLAELSTLPLWATMVIATLVAALPLSWIIGFALGGMRYDPRILGDGFLILYAECAGIGIVIFLLMRKLFPAGTAPKVTGERSVSPLPTDFPFAAPPDVPGESRAAPAKDEALAGKSRLHNRLPPAFGPVLALAVEDHYVRVHGASRSEMLLMRLSDAIDEMEGVDGLRVHRSWWVAREAVRDARRDGRVVSLTLNNGLVVPVSRANVTHLKNSGWLTGIGV